MLETVLIPVVAQVQQNFWTDCLLLAATLCAIYLWGVFFQPLNFVRSVGEVENSIEGGRFLNHVGPGKRKFGTKIPPVYPNGWFKLIDSNLLKKDQSRYVSIIGEHFAVFRGESGEVHVLDAYCPHLGANLGVGGKVKGNCLECPFHGWKFDGSSGQCVGIPYSQSVPTGARTKRWQSVELNQSVYVWFDAEGRSPSWEPKPPMWESPTVQVTTPHGRTEHHVTGHIQEIPENGADTAHLNVLHTPLSLFHWLPFTHKWSASWEPGTEPEGHLAHAVVKEELSVRGWRIPGTSVEAQVTQIGPGIVYLQFSTVIGRMLIVETVSPVAPFHLEVDHIIFAERHIPRIIAKIVLRMMSSQFERDVPIWNSKTFLPAPMVVKGDGRILQFRRWFSQFYSEHSPTIHSEKEKSLEW